MARKKFGISASVSSALSQTAQLAETDNSNLYNTEILLGRIKLDPENPRKHKITLDDLENGPSNNDPYYHQKNEEFLGLCELAESIKKDGLLHPIAVIEDGSDFKLVAGERRFLASKIAKKNSIEARVFKTKPNTLDLRIIQWMENESRKDLSLFNKLKNIEAICTAYKAANFKKMTAVDLAHAVSFSRQSAQYYLAILSNPVLMKYIEEGKVNTFRKARELVEFKSSDELDNELEATVKAADKEIPKANSTPRNKSVSKYSLGSTTNKKVLRTIIESVMSSGIIDQAGLDLENINWANDKDTMNAYKKLLRAMEEKL